MGVSALDIQTFPGFFRRPSILWWSIVGLENDQPEGFTPIFQIYRENISRTDFKEHFNFRK
jgi:hypothetical protein